MFIHLFRYQCKKILHTRETTFWTFMFPLILATLFNFAFKGLMEGVEYEPVPVAVVYEDADSSVFPMVLEAVSSGEDALFDVKEVSEEKAEKLLASKKVEGIIMVGEEISLQISEEGGGQTVIKCFLDEYIRTGQMITDRIKNNPAAIPDVITDMKQGVNYAAASSLDETGGNTSWLLQFFYALLAMSCLYAAFPGLDCALDMQVNVIGVAARKNAACVHRLQMIAAEFLATVLFAFASSVISVVYLTQVLQIDLGDHMAGVLLTCLAGDLVGVSLGIIIGSVKRWSESIKVAVLLAVTMSSCFFAGLMVSGIKGTIEAYVPIFNRINPGAVISDCFYALNMYDGMGRFAQDIYILYAMAFALCILSYILLRRQRCT